MVHANNLVNAMRLADYSLADLLPAYPGKDEAYVDHLLRDTALPSNRFVMPYGLLGTQPCSSQYFNVHPGGFRSNGRYQPWPPDHDKINIFFFGGSTTIGYGIEDGQTIPAQLQRSLDTEGVKCEVYNFGAGAYATRHAALRFLDLLDQDIVPDYAIVLGGYNDSIFGLGHRALVGLFDMLFQHERRRRGSSWLRAVMDFAFNSYLERRKPYIFDEPLVRSVDDPEIDTYFTDEGIRIGLENSTTQLSVDDISAAGARLAERVWKSFLDSVALIRSVSNRKNIETMFVWQPVPWFMTTPQQRIMDQLFYVYRQSVFCSPVYHWLHAQDFPSLRDDPDFVNLAGAGSSLAGKLYVDFAHYSSFFCEHIAAVLSGELLARKWLPVSG